MKTFILAALCITIVSAQHHGNKGYSSRGGYGGHQQSSSGGMSGGYQSSSGGMSGGYQSSSGGMSGGHHRSGRSLVSQGYSVVGAGHLAAGPAVVNSGSYGHSGHRMGRSTGATTSIGPVPVPAVYVNAGHAGHRRGRSVSLLPVVGHSGLGQVAGGYTQGGHYGGHRYSRSVVDLAPVAGQASYSGLTLATGHYGSVAGHGHRMASSLAGHSSGSYGGSYSNAGYQRGSTGVHHG